MLRLSELPRAEAQAQHDNKNKNHIKIFILRACSSSLAKKNQVEEPVPSVAEGTPIPAMPGVDRHRYKLVEGDQP